MRSLSSGSGINAFEIDDLSNEAIAVIGLSCRLPQAPSPNAFWRVLREGVDAITEMPPGRWDADALDDVDLSLAGKATARHGGFLPQVDRFDADFFGISPREAVAMDPQQRLMLELCWEAFEDAGIVAARVRGSRTGVFVGAIGDDYATLLHQQGLGAITQHVTTGLHRGIIANRVSYVLGLRGPSMTVDSAQSSSLVAVHLACESLRRGESSLAIAGGVNLILAPESTVGAAKFGGLSPDGRCFTFDARANGYVRGEGGGVVVLKPLTRAVAEGDRIYGVIRGSAVNNDGVTEGLTVPSVVAQQEVVRLACERAGVDPRCVQYVELHGTGTRLGDPIEARALGAALGGVRGDKAPVVVGSAKTNVGHLEGAAGIVGLLKLVLSVWHGEIPASLNFQTPNPGIPLEALNLRVAQTLGPWPGGDRPLVGGVSSFGMGGTNCHVVVSQGPRATQRPDRPVPAVVPWVLSAKSETALRAQAERLGEHVDTHPDLDVADVGYSLVTSRSVFAHRAVVVAGDREDFLRGLDALGEGQAALGLVHGVAGAGDRVVFVFPGQGSQWVGMALELLESSPVFAQRLAECERALAPFVDWSLVEMLRDGSALGRVDVVQPVLFAVMVSLAGLWRSFGVEPAAVVGHSQGEIAAACVAGALSLEDAARVVALRSQAWLGLVGRGGMVSVALPAEEVCAWIGRWPDQLAVAAVNGPGSTVVSGDPGALDELLVELTAQGVRARRVPVWIRQGIRLRWRCCGSSWWRCWLGCRLGRR